MDDDNAGAILRARLGAMHQERYQRVEVITGERRRRDWLPEEKDQILSECADSDANLSAIARRYGVNRGLLNKWRKAAGLPVGRPGGKRAEAMPAFVPVTISRERAGERSGGMNGLDIAAGRIEIEVGGGRMVMSGTIAPDLAHAVVSALRGKR
ncbi:transposase (plasmid) [Agrobacterium leguminum]|uniref:IS66-like element accessory protein TnpA n=1 Tax=Agrobacterium leguminum TaxID=2792015 RepID=UPI00272B0649|nr:transposase [Agrobacterium leguminum]WLE00805.1 transposase [Agrobacterium leguminum]